MYIQPTSYYNHQYKTTFKGAPQAAKRTSASSLNYISNTLSEIITSVKDKTGDGLRAIEGIVGDFNFFGNNTFIFKNVGNENLTYNISRYKNSKVGKQLSIDITDDRGIIKSNVILDEKSQVLTPNQNEINLDEVIENLDFLTLKVRKAITQTNGQNLKDYMLIPANMMLKLKNMSAIYESIDNNLKELPHSTSYKRKTAFNDYEFISGQTAHKFKNAGPDGLKFVYSPVNNKNHGEFTRFLIYDKDDKLLNGYLIKDHARIVSNFNPEYFAVIPDEITYLSNDVLKNQNYLRELNSYMNPAEEKLNSFKIHLEKYNPKAEGSLNPQDNLTALKIEELYNEVSSELKSLSFPLANAIKKEYGKLELIAGKQGYTFVDVGSQKEKITIFPASAKDGKKLLKITIYNSDNEHFKTFLIQDGEKVVKNFNPDYPQLIPPKLKYFNEEELEQLGISDYLKIINEEIQKFRDYAIPKSIEGKNRIAAVKAKPKISLKELKVNDEKSIKISSQSPYLHNEDYKKLMSECKKRMDNTFKNFSGNMEDFEKTFKEIQEKISTFMSDKK